jgi:hypothetical protein
MNDELPDLLKRTHSLEARFANRPHVLARLHEIADLMDKAIAGGATADEAEEMVIEQLRQLGADALSDYATEKQKESLQRAQEKYPHAIKHIKKK